MPPVDKYTACSICPLLQLPDTTDVPPPLLLDEPLPLSLTSSWPQPAVPGLSGTIEGLWRGLPPCRADVWLRADKVGWLRADVWLRADMRGVPMGVGSAVLASEREPQPPPKPTSGRTTSAIGFCPESSLPHGIARIGGIRRAAALALLALLAILLSTTAIAAATAAAATSTSTFSRAPLSA
jgi:hypothetical protein